MAQTNVFITRGCHLIQILKIDYFAGDSMIFTNHNSFTTKDRDYDPDPYMNCAQFRLGAWWLLQLKWTVFSRINHELYICTLVLLEKQLLLTKKDYYDDKENT